VTSRPELTDRQTYRHPTKEKIPYLVESSLAQSMKKFGRPKFDLGFQVVVMHVVEDDYAWILPECNVDTWNVMKAQLQKARPPTTKIEPMDGRRYLALFHGEWWRVRVENVVPLRLHYIDYGNVEEGETVIRLMPWEIFRVKPLVIIQ